MLGSRKGSESWIYFHSLLSIFPTFFFNIPVTSLVFFQNTHFFPETRLELSGGWGGHGGVIGSGAGKPPLARGFGLRWFRRCVMRYVSRYYLKSTMIMLYESVLYPINRVDNWPKSSYGSLELAPPRSKRQRGRPKKLRREEPQIRLHADGGESLRRTFVMKCRRCGQEGHNRRTCSNDPRTYARSEVGSRESDERTLPPESSNNRQCQQPNESDPGSNTRARARTQPQRTTTRTQPQRTRARTHPQRCGRRGDQD